MRADVLHIGHDRVLPLPFAMTITQRVVFAVVLFATQLAGIITGVFLAGWLYPEPTGWRALAFAVGWVAGSVAAPAAAGFVTRRWKP